MKGGKLYSHWGRHSLQSGSDKIIFKTFMECWE